MAQQYIASLVDPFDQTIPQPKLLDGSVTYSAGLRFRQSGMINMSEDGTPNLIALIPGFSQNLTFKAATHTEFRTPVAYPSHYDTAANRAVIRKIRLVSCAARFQLMNSSDDNEGYWEAVRMPLETLRFQDQIVPTGEDAAMELELSFDPGNMASQPTYQTGLLRDLYRFQFKLNSVSPEHPFLLGNPSHSQSPLSYEPTSFDCVVIRIFGRSVVGSPSIVRYDTISNQEVVYDEKTTLARLQTPNVMVPGLGVLLDKTRYVLPAVQIT